jgi:hypothetical protein
MPLSAGNGTMDETVRLDASTAGIIILQESGCMSVKSALVLAKKDMGAPDAVIVKWSYKRVLLFSPAID